LETHHGIAFKNELVADVFAIDNLVVYRSLNDSPDPLEFRPAFARTGENQEREQKKKSGCESNDPNLGPDAQTAPDPFWHWSGFWQTVILRFHGVIFDGSDRGRK
jgi:hypothetical protein